MKKIAITIFMTLASFLCINANAQTGYERQDEINTPPPPPDDPVDVPLDGGLTVLLSAGVAYGLKKARAHAKRA